MAYQSSPYAGKSCAPRDLSLSSFSSRQGKIDSFCSDRGKINGNMYEETVQGYTPTSGYFAMDTITSLMTKPNLARATVGTNNDVLRLPEKAVVTSVSIRHNGTPLVGSGVNFDIGTAAFGVTGNQIFDAVAIATINAGGAAVGSSENVGSTGGTGLSGTANFVTFKTLSGTLTAGNFVVSITYMHVPGYLT